MKIKILGTANAWGINELISVYPQNGTLLSGRLVPFRKYRTSILITSIEDQNILIDCGPDFSHQRKEYGISKIDALFITHPHLDHIGGLDDLNIFKNAGHPIINVYAHSDCWKVIREQKGYGYLIDKVIKENFLKEFSPIIVGSSFRVIPFGVEHSKFAPGACGFIFEEEVDGKCKRFAYTGDFWAISNPTHAIFKDPLDFLLIECDRFSGLAGPEVGGGHMSFEESIRSLQSGVFCKSKPQQVSYIHFGDDGPKGISSVYKDWRDEIIKNLKVHGLSVLSEDYVVAYEGMEVTL